MNRPNRHLLGIFAALLTAATPALCADLLVDGFTDELDSHLKWVNTDESTLKHSVGGGSCTLDNSASQYIGEYKHTFDASKPAVFTISYVLKSITGNNIAGALFCRQPDSRSGYILTTENGEVVVYKITTSGNSINAAPIFYKKSFDLKPADNKLTISKSGQTFNVFANDAFAGSFTDASYNSGDLSLVTFANTKAVFGAVRVTDAFTEGSPRTSFSDDFNGNGLKYWQPLKNGSPSVTEAGGVMSVRTAAGEVAWMYIDFEHADFTAKVEASHRSGSMSSTYGFALIGESAPGQNIPMVHFAITGERKYAIWKSGTTTYPNPNTAIKGAAVGGTFFVDNLEIRKGSGQSAYEFFANGTRLDAYPAADVGFKVAGVGVFCYSELEVTFDNFSLIKDGTTSVNRGSKQFSRNPSPPAINRDQAFYDLRGRKRHAIATTSSSIADRAQTKAAGIYVNKNGRDVAVRKRK